MKNSSRSVLQFHLGKMRILEMPLALDAQQSKTLHGGYWWDLYPKINLWRIRMSKLLYLDTDMLVFSSELGDLLNSTELKPGHIAMVKDCCSNDFNSGLILMRPDRRMYSRIRFSMEEKQGWAALDQPVINEVFKDRIQTLDARFNVHGHGMPCGKAVVAHYTGRKPATPDPASLELIRDGFVLDRPNPHCGNLMRLYFSALKAGANDVSAELSLALKHVQVKAGLDCSVDDEDRSACGHSDIGPAQCQAKSCCHVSSGAPSCFRTQRAKAKECAVMEYARADCGIGDIDETICAAKGCCYDPNSRRNNTPACFYKWPNPTKMQVL